MRISDDLTTHPLYRRNLKTIEGLILALRQSHTLRDLGNLQERLFAAIRSAEGGQQSAENSAQRCADVRREVLRVKAQGGRFDKVKLWESQQEEKVYTLRAEVLKHIRLQLRSVGDGLLWKAVAYDRGYIGAVSAAQTTNWCSIMFATLRMPPYGIPFTCTLLSSGPGNRLSPFIVRRQRSFLP